MFDRLLNTFNHWKFDKKMKVYIFSNIIIASTIILVVSTVYSVSFSIKQSRKMAEEQLFSMASNYNETLNNYKSLSEALIMDSSLQNYLTSDKKKDSQYYQLRSSVTNTLSNATNIYSNINFIGIVDATASDYIYKGDIAIFATYFKELYKEDYQKSTNPGIGALRISYNSSYFKNNDSSLTIYHPIYSTKKVGVQLGLLCINLNDNNLEQIFTRNHSYNNSEVHLLDSTGTILSDLNSPKTLRKVDYLDKLDKRKGSFKKNSKLYIYQKIGKWNYYLIYTIPRKELIGSSINVMITLFLLVFMMAIITLFTSRKLVNLAYKPLNSVIIKMDAVSLGKLDVRMDAENVGEDFVKLSTGFNSMMDKIILLMESIKNEQDQLNQLRFNALQSQIKPHFLYNTLECIHWQAISEGNEDVSTLVKALAAYYKICLSKGKDIISLDQEIEHIKNYITIQNMRYDNIIDIDIQINPVFNNVRIPKITLQPLIENSIYHGFKIKEGKHGKISLHIEKDGDDVILILADTGMGMTQDQIDEMNNSMSDYEDRFGYGVRNTNKRIQLLFGDKYGLYYMKNKGDGITVIIRLPFKAEIKYKGVL